MIYVYDGTWSGMMTLVHRTARDGVFPDDIARFASKVMDGVLLESSAVKTDPSVAEATAAVLERRVGAQQLSEACLALMSEERGIDLAVWCHLSRLWHEGDRAAMDLAAPCAGFVLRAARRSTRELHRWMGLIRFRDAGGVYYASFAPECDVLPLLADHFCGRLPDRWMLHDVSRGRAALHDRGRWLLTDAVPPARDPGMTREEEACQELWREFFRSTSVKERRSAKRQRQFLPKRTWAYLVERPGAASSDSPGDPTSPTARQEPLTARFGADRLDGYGADTSATA